MGPAYPKIARRVCQRIASLLRCAGTSSALLFGLLGIPIAYATPPSPSLTVLTVTSAGTSAVTVQAGAAVALNAAVTVSGTPLHRGLVQFCDATAPYCSGIYLLGSAQLTSAGTATLRIRPSIGGHSYAAIFTGTEHAAPSYSSAVQLAVQGIIPTALATTLSGASPYAVSATVTGRGRPQVNELGGTLSLLDTTDSNHVLSTVPLAKAAPQLEWAGGATLRTGVRPLSLATGDFNNDGILDIAVANSNLPDSGPSPAGTISVYLGVGDGTFQAAPHGPFTAGTQTSVIAVADLNGDGFQDLVAANENSGDLTIYLGAGDGTFSAASGSPVSLGGGLQPEALTIGDFDNDGIPDIAVTGWASVEGVAILLGDGHGAFAPPSFVQLDVDASDCLAIAALDLNGDGNLDLLVDRSVDQKISVLLGAGDGTFTEAPSGPVATGTDPESLATGDFNADGKPDFAVLNSADKFLQVFLGNGDGSFVAASASPIANPAFLSAYSVVVGDFNADGFDDLAVPTGAGSVFIYLGNGNGTFTVSTSGALAGDTPIGVAVSDFDGDGVPDLVSAGYGSNNAVVQLTNLQQVATAGFSGIAPVGIGKHNVVASFPGIGDYGSSQSVPMQLNAYGGAPAVTVTASRSALLTTDSLTITVKVDAGASNPVPAGAVLLKSGAYSLAANSLTAGTATVTVPAGSLALGSNIIAATYTPDPASAILYAAATGSSAAILVSKPSAVLTLTPVSTLFLTTQPIKVAVAVAGTPVPTGAVTLTSGAYTSSPAPLASGSATITIPAGTLAAGSNPLSVAYSGDTVFAGDNGTASVTVTNLQIAASSVSAVTAGTAATSTVTITNDAYYTGSLKLTCTLTTSPAGATHLPTCAVSPASLAVTAAGITTATFTMSSTAATHAQSILPDRPFGLGKTGAGVALATLFIVGIPRRRRWASLALLFLVASIAGLSGCGGKAKPATTTPTTPTTPGTTAGSYVFTVNAIDAQNASLSVSTNVTITVQ